MITFKELFKKTINEGTQATIAVTTKSGKIKQSMLQYDGYLEGAGKDLLKYFNNTKSAEKLVQKTGEIRGINGKEVEYYDDRTLLKTFRTEAHYKSSGMTASYNYFWDGEEWLYSENNLGNFKKLK